MHPSKLLEALIWASTASAIVPILAGGSCAKLGAKSLQEVGSYKHRVCVCVCACAAVDTAACSACKAVDTAERMCVKR